MTTDGLDIHIRRTVRWLRRLGFRTIDSGDGRSKRGGPHEWCMQPFPNVMVVVPAAQLVAETDRLVAELGRRGIPVHGIGTWGIHHDPWYRDQVRIEGDMEPYAPGAEIQATYQPVSSRGAFADIQLLYVDDALLFGEPGGWHEDADARALAMEPEGVSGQAEEDGDAP